MKQEQIASVVRGIGRPPKFENPEDMIEAIEDYFVNIATHIDDDGNVHFKPLISGLAFHLGMTTESLRNYESKDDFFAIVKRAKQIVEMSAENRLEGPTTTGAIFLLKSNFKWSESSEEEQQDQKTTRLEIEVVGANVNSKD